MSVILAGVTLNSNLVLEGQLNTPNILWSATPTFGGEVIQTMPVSLGHLLHIKALSSGAKQGWFCKSQIESLRDIADVGGEVTLQYYGDNYSGIIVEFDLVEWFSWEPPNPNKRYSGHIAFKCKE